MSSSIWMRCAGSSRLRALECDAWRVVEAQHRTSTRKLVDSDEEQRVLEELLERAKPPAGRDTKTLHYLLSTPFRYPPLRKGTRFGSRTERGLWYGSHTRRTVFSEVAYYRLVFLDGTTPALGPLEVDLTCFRASIRTFRGVDLTRPPFDAHARVLASRTKYDATQELGAEMRAAGVEAFHFTAARDVKGGKNVAVFAPSAFSSRKPKELQTWHCIANRAHVEVTLKDYFTRESFDFPRKDFEVNGRIPAPAL